MPHTLLNKPHTIITGVLKHNGVVCAKVQTSTSCYSHYDHSLVRDAFTKAMVPDISISVKDTYDIREGIHDILSDNLYKGIYSVTAPLATRPDEYELTFYAGYRNDPQHNELMNL